MADQMFCIAKKRPTYCRMGNNICCCFCDLNEHCQRLHKDEKLKPCKVGENTAEEPCELAI